MCTVSVSARWTYFRVFETSGEFQELDEGARAVVSSRFVVGSQIAKSFRLAITSTRNIARQHEIATRTEFT